VDDVAAWILGGTAATIAVVAAVFNWPRVFGRRLRVGDRVRIRGGYSDQPEWLVGRESVTGYVSAFLPGGSVEVQLDSAMSRGLVVYRVAVLSLRWKNARWLSSGVVHVELWEHSPSEKGAQLAAHEWVESHAAYRRVRTSRPAR
jgi:hypothetical protein